MTFKLACGDVMPGCTARFEAADTETLLREVAAHARSTHDLAVTPEVAQTVLGHVTTD